MLTLRSHEGRDRRCRREGMVDGSMSEGEGAMRTREEGGGGGWGDEVAREGEGEGCVRFMGLAQI
jgi:hypothetical protein